MQARIRINNLEETGYSINSHVRKISNGFIVSDKGTETAYDTLKKAKSEFKKSAESQKDEIKTRMQEQIDKLQTALTNIDSLYEEAIAEADKELEQLEPKTPTN